MTELEPLNFARSTLQNEINLFTQVITITFAMIVGIYYFLNQARLMMKLFAFLAYMIGAMLFLGEMLLESNMKVSAMAALQKLPHPSTVVQRYIELNDSWLSSATSFLFNGAFWLLCLGIFYLLFFWRKTATEESAA
jgi:multisubunit Na+/H+ antiporter MnhE subunit